MNRPLFTIVVVYALTVGSNAVFAVPLQTESIFENVRLPVVGLLQDDSPCLLTERRAVDICEPPAH